MSYTPSRAHVQGWTAFAHWSHASAQLSPDAKKRLAWFDYYRTTKNVALTCRHFGISRKTFYTWQKRYKTNAPVSLESKPSVPIKKRQRMTTPEEEVRIVALRKQHIRYGKEKLALVHTTTFGDPMTAWKVQKVIEKYQIYYHPAKNARTQAKRRKAEKRKHITELKKKQVSEFLICLDTIIIYWGGLKRYIFTGIDSVSKVAFARMYTTKASYNGADFLTRLTFLLDGKITNVGHDNGSEFQKHFAQACAKLGYAQYFSRPNTPKDNAVCERFNQTLRHEFLELGNLTADADVFNRNLTEWLVEYNFRRPHQTLGYLPPINFEVKYLKVLPRYPSSTTNSPRNRYVLYCKAMMTSIPINKSLALLACIAVIAVATCGIDTGMHTAHNSTMPACPFMTGMTALCGLDTAGRVTAWQNLFTASPSKVYAAIFLIIITLFGSILGKDTTETRQRLWHRDGLSRKLFDPLTQLFSDGILNTKLYAGA